jgi:hypothetical protein
VIGGEAGADRERDRQMRFAGAGRPEQHDVLLGVTRVPADPHVRVDTNDYSLEPGLVGRRVELRVSQRQVLAVALDTGELAGRHERSFARHRTITALEHARALKAGRHQGQVEPEVETRPLARYDALIPA